MPVQMHADEQARCQHCPNLADERSFMCEDCASVADGEVMRLREALAQASRRIDQIQRDRRERDKVFGCCHTARAEIRRALDGV